MKAIFICLGLGLCLTTAPFANATMVDFTTGTSNDGTMGNSLCYNSSGASTACNGSQFLTVTAWGVTGNPNGNTTFQPGALGHYAGSNLGLGVCNAAQGTNCSSPNHEVDNSGHLDFVLFQFSGTVTAASVVLNPVCDCGFTDSTYYTGSATGTISGKSLATLGTVGFGSASPARTGGNSQQSVTITGISSGMKYLDFTATGALSGRLFQDRIADLHPWVRRSRAQFAHLAWPRPRPACLVAAPQDRRISQELSPQS